MTTKEPLLNIKIDFKNIQIKTKRLIIRPLRMSDYENWLNSYTKRMPKQHKYDRGPHDPKETPKRWFKELIAKHKKISSED